MQDKGLTQAQLLTELIALRQRVAELEKSNAELKQTEEELTENEGRLSTIWESVQTGIVIIDPENHVIVDVNPAAAHMIGTSNDQIIGSICHKHICPAEVGRCPITDRGETVDSSERLLLTAGGEKRSIIKTVMNVMLGGRTHLLESFVDITERKRMEEEIREMSLRDQLTELYNRRGFITLAEQQLKLSDRTKKGMLLFFADLDGMKWINDTLGHEEGDKALIEVSTVLKETFRKSDIIARMGGDEFAVLAIDVTDLDTEVLSKRLQQNMDGWNAKESRQYKLAVSWGTASYDPESPVSLDQLMSEADRLMYARKKAK